MGLSISVGSLAWLKKEEADPEAMVWLRKELAHVNRVLRANGLPEHVEPEELPPWVDRGLSGFPYSWLHYLRRAVAFARQAPAEFGPLPDGEEASEDRRIDRELSVFMDSHLICHSDADGFYVPIDFPEPLYDDNDELTGGILGSSQRALAEVVLAAPLLGIEMENGKPTKTAVDTIREEEDEAHPLWVERQVWLAMYEKFRLSIEHGTAVVFG
jgi:hypothetical protein